MSVVRHGGRRAVASVLRSLRDARVRRTFASRIDLPFIPPRVPIIERCPSPTCQCRGMPAGLDIERVQNINGSMAAYAEHILISTGRSDWASRVEEEESADGAFVRQLKGFLTRGGQYADPYHNVMITTSSIPPTRSPTHRSHRLDKPASQSSSVPAAQTGQDPAIDREQSVPGTPLASAFLLPSFQYVPSIPIESTAVNQFLKAFVLPSRLHQAHETRSREDQKILLRHPELQRKFVGVRKVDELLVLICGHNARDARCGVLGPLLQAEFEEKLQRQNVPVLHDPPVAEAEIVDTDVEGYVPTARTALISHMGGHKWAGNVIIYIPPSWKRHPLAGKGIWYGRVGPEHVEGIVSKTILDGKVIREFFRGGIDENRDIIRL